MRSRHEISFFHDYQRQPFPEKRLKSAAKSLFSGERVRMPIRCNVILCSDKKIRGLNRKFRQKDRPTDVLAFPLEEKGFLGEIYISLQRAYVQARRFRVSYEEEVALLMVHGLLHLLGYDHDKKEDKKIMEQLQRRYSCLKHVN